MSHVTTLDFEVRDLTELTNAAAALGGQLVTQSRFRYFAGATERCDAAIVVPGSDYDIGVTSLADGSYALSYDNWQSTNNTLEQHFGAGLKSLKQHYTANVAAKHLKRQGFRELSRTLDAAGLLHVKLGR